MLESAFCKALAVWLWFGVAQLISIVAALCGMVLMLPLCAFHLWKDTPSTFDPKRPSDKWVLPINWVYGNPEEGVSGKYALIWDNGKKVPYMPDSNYFWRAYCWNLRNNADNLKYVFAWKKLFGWKNGPLVQKDYTPPNWLPIVGGKTRTFKAGWQVENGIDVLVLSL